MKEKQFIKVVALQTEDGFAFEYGLVNAISKDEAYMDKDFNNDVYKKYESDKTVTLLANDVVIDIQELRNNAGSSLNFDRKLGES